ncbi:UNVERIFIED_CONTAM: hypothetical protein GTU68_036173 [Idotea baltica]|nr:hypothetical protein [Idotea baltica]
MTTSYTGFASCPSDPEADQFWQTIINVRDEVSKQIEAIRVAGEIGAGLDACVTLYADDQLSGALNRITDELRFVLITSDVRVLPLDAADDEATQTELAGLKVLVEAMSDEKCVRCWHRRPEVGEIAKHPELCSRCVENIEGEGEQRLYA